MQAKSTGDIMRSLLVFKACQVGPLVRNADALLRLSKRVLGTRLTNALLRPTFYKQFVAGADAQSIQPTLLQLRRSGIRAILDYAAEDDVQEEAAPKQQAQLQQPQGVEEANLGHEEPRTGSWLLAASAWGWGCGGHACWPVAAAARAQAPPKLPRSASGSRRKCP